MVGTSPGISLIGVPPATASVRNIPDSVKQIYNISMNVLGSAVHLRPGIAQCEDGRHAWEGSSGWRSDGAISSRNHQVNPFCSGKTKPRKTRHSSWLAKAGTRDSGAGSTYPGELADLLQTTAHSGLPKFIMRAPAPLATITSRLVKTSREFCPLAVPPRIQDGTRPYAH
jgi:hypothetical protein